MPVNSTTTSYEVLLRTLYDEETETQEVKQIDESTVELEFKSTDLYCIRLPWLLVMFLQRETMAYGKGIIRSTLLISLSPRQLSPCS